MSQTILVVDDDAGHRQMLEALLRRWKYTVEAVDSGEAAVAAVAHTPYDAVLMDVRMAGMDGLSAQKAIREYNPAVPVIIMTAYSAVESAVEALKSGAYDYLVKPLDFDVLRLTLERTLEHGKLKVENSTLREQADLRPRCGIVGTGEAIHALQTMILTVGPSEATVLIAGKSGTGKELVARAIHAASSRKDKPLVVVNCAALSEHLLESEMFGHEKGSFTGADKRRDGRFMQADGGTLFLDEVGEMPLPMQAKLLRAIQQREIQRVGSDVTLSVDVRLVAATNRDLAEEVRLGRFREDLYYRLNVVSLHVPEMREHREDIPLLAQHFLIMHGERNRKQVKGFTPQAMNRLLLYDWPGNVRELENVIERAVVLLYGDFVSERELPPALLAATEPRGDAGGRGTERTGAGAGTLEEAERGIILQTLKAVNDNKSEAAKRLGISRKTLHIKLKKYAGEDTDEES